MNTYLVMTQQIPKRVFEYVEARTIVEASARGVVMLLVSPVTTNAANSTSDVVAQVALTRSPSTHSASPRSIMRATWSSALRRSVRSASDPSTWAR